MASGSGQPVSGRTRGESRDREGSGGGRGISEAQSRAGLGGQVAGAPACLQGSEEEDREICWRF